MNKRPELTHEIAGDQFEDHYWLKNELVAFCRINQIPASGTKILLSARIAAFLRGEPLATEATKRIVRPMPQDFTLEMKIEKGWRCSQALRGFFERMTGKKFGFDEVLRQQIAQGEGITLQQALSAWEQRQEMKPKNTIAPQFEYNRFVRRYRALKPGLKHSEVVTAWKYFRSLPRSTRPTIDELAASGPFS